MATIRCENVWKSFPTYAGHALLRQHLKAWFTGKEAEHARFQALKGVSFELSSGESLGLIGSNGAGKSTLLSLVTGLAKPDRGSIEVSGRVAALMELGSGFHPDLTGRENVYLNASLLGFTEKQTKEMFGAIVDFSGVGDFIDEPLRAYSSGMYVRLAFSIAVNVDPEILIIDEVLAVGDHKFQEKCFDRIRSFRRQGKMFLCVSHNRAMLQELCDRALWLEHGEMMMTGKLDDVFAAYEGRAALSSSAR